ncbi:MAG: hypothetical protein JSV95_08385, partial [Gemmatimonadota bacterium]
MVGELHHMLGELDRAEEHLRQGLAIRESLNLPDVYKDYGNLTMLARDHGDEEAAAEWQAKHDAKLAELKRLRTGGRSAGVSEQFVSAVLALAQVVYGVRVHGDGLPPEAAEAVAKLSSLPSSLGGVGAFLEAVAGGGP